MDFQHEEQKSNTSALVMALALALVQTKAELFIVRISPTRHTPGSDYTMFTNDIELTGNGKWDQDFNGKMKTGDYLAFITGINGNEMVNIFKVTKTLPLSEREVWWSKNAYTTGNGINNTKNRIPLILTNEHELPKTWAWKDIKEKVGLSPNCSTWMPRGTQRVKNASRMPFLNPF